MTPDFYCQQKAAQGGPSFYYSVLFVKPAQRKALNALYAFHREVSDVVNLTGDENAARIKLAWWRHEIGEAFGGRPQHLVTRALADSLPDHAIAQEHLEEIIDGRELDLLQNRYLDAAGVERYSGFVSGAFAASAAGILGNQSGNVTEYARHLGLALQWTRVIRDVGADARRGRVYLPIDELQRFNVPVADILNARYSEKFRALMEFQHQRATACFERAIAALPGDARPAQRPGLIMAATSRTLLNEIRAENYQVLHQRLSLTPVRKLWIAWKTWTFP
jgi:phytoene synthase